MKAHRFLSFHGEHGKINKAQEYSIINYGLWKKCHNAIKDHGDNGAARNCKTEVWISLDEVFRILNITIGRKIDILKLKIALRNFGKSMRDAWSDKSITHYMVNLYNAFSIYKAKTY